MSDYRVTQGRGKWATHLKPVVKWVPPKPSSQSKYSAFLFEFILCMET